MVLLKWAGSKQSSRRFIADRIGIVEGSYREPFFGGGSVAFELLARRAIHGDVYISDDDVDLILFWVSVRDHGRELIDVISDLVNTAILSRDRYKHVRDVFNRRKTDDNLSHECKEKNDLLRSAMIYFLNRTGFNGLWRRNSKGEFNVPLGDNKGIDLEKMEADVNIHSKLLHGAIITVSDFEPAVSSARDGDTIYLDPPYYSDTGKNFTQYGGTIFTENDMRTMYACAVNSVRKGARVFISAPGYFDPDNVQAKRIAVIHTLQVRRSINRNGEGRGSVPEKLLELSRNSIRRLDEKNENVEQNRQ